MIDNSTILFQNVLFTIYVVQGLSLLLASAKVSKWEKNRGVRYMTNMLGLTALASFIKAGAVVYTMLVGLPLDHDVDMVHRLVFLVAATLGQGLEVVSQVVFVLYLTGILNGITNPNANPPAKQAVETAIEANQNKK